MASLQEQYKKLTSAQKKEVDRIRNKGISFSPDVGGIEGLAQKGGGVSSSGQYIPPKKIGSAAVQTQPEFDLMEQFRKLQEAQARAQIASLEKARGSQLSALRAEEEGIAPRFQEARRGAITESERGRRGLEQFLAQRGLQGSGAGAQSELAQNVAQQQQLGGLRQREAESFADIERRRSGVEQAFASDVAAAEAGAQAQALQNAINQQNLERQLALQEAGLTGMLGGQQTLAGRAAEQSAQLFDVQRQQIEQALEAGEISNEQARYALDQARDPDSIQNQVANIELQLAQANLDFLPQQQQLQLEQLRRSIAQIGRRPVLSEVQKRQQELQLLQINNDIDRLTSGGGSDLSENIPIVQQGIESALGRIPTIDEAGFDISVSPDLQRAETATQIVRAFQAGQIGEAEVQQLMTANGLTEKDIQRAVNLIGVTSGQIPLP